nr:hypothetical protein [Polymorphobacter sp.]
MNSVRILLVSVLVALLSACEPKSPSDVFLIPRERLVLEERDGNSGDLAAIKRLIAHYDATSGNERAAEKWRAKARSFGDAQELHSYAAGLSVRALAEPDPLKKRRILTEALESAKRSYKNDPDVSTQDLIYEIERSLAG